MKKLLLVSICSLYSLAIFAKQSDNNKELCARISQSIAASEGAKSIGKQGEKGGLTDSQYDSCVKTAKTKTSKKEKCAAISQHLASTKGAKSVGKRGEKGGLTDAQYDDCVSSQQ